MSSNKEKRVKKKIITLKNKGFTLVELLGVVAILSVIMGISIMSFTSVKKNTLKQQYDNIVSLIETEAANYANKTGITTVSVEKLILEGYLEPDDETDIYNPQNNASLNCHIVNSTFSDGEYASTMSETNLRKDDGTCDEYKVTSEYEICQMSGSSCITIPDNKWFNSDVTLGVKHTRTGRIIDTSTARFEWSSTTGNMGTGSTITASTTTVIQSTFKVKLITTDNKLGEATQLVKIDRQNPVVVGVSVDTAWSTEKKVIVTANDFTGSGVKGIYVGTETTCRSNMPYQTANNNKIILEKEDGEYYACAIDNVGNFSNTAYRIKVDNSDTEGADTISLTPNPATWANKIELIGKAQDLKSGLVAYQFIETRKTQIPPDDPNWIFDIPDAERNSEITRIRPDVTDETKTYYFWVLDMMGNTSVASYKPDKLDKKGAET
ncbi:MAG: prepilin-type N-terminal cleavage/methylation domain-containing protein, partial [Bacilli bacterium]|nr:prepilin-type N-terminal cleavage/methylation domain-containing protein [Bacilli bacterium]